MNNTLYLASASVQRARMLQEAGISFEPVLHTADEKSCAWDRDLEPLTRQLAQLKMDHVVLPILKDSPTHAFVLTADTLTMHNNQIIGKPHDHADAVSIIKRVRDGVWCGTAFCLERRELDGPAWHIQQRYTGYAHGWCSLAITDDEILLYFENLKRYSGFDYLKLAGAFSITGYGAQFLKEIHGSYTAILGLPMAELREGLNAVGFYIKD